MYIPLKMNDIVLNKCIKEEELLLFVRSTDVQRRIFPRRGGLFSGAISIRKPSLCPINIS